MTFITFSLCALVFVVVGFSAGGVWFLFCRWDENQNSRNYKSLVVVIPVTLLIAAFANIMTAIRENKTLAIISTPVIPTPLLQNKEKKKLGKKTVKKSSEKVEAPKEEWVELKHGGKIRVARPVSERNEDDND